MLLSLLYSIKLQGEVSPGVWSCCRRKVRGTWRVRADRNFSFRIPREMSLWLCHTLHTLQLCYTPYSSAYVQFKMTSAAMTTLDSHIRAVGPSLACRTRFHFPLEKKQNMDITPFAWQHTQSITGHFKADR